MVTVANVKSYIHIPYSDEDSFIQTACINGGYDYLDDAIDNFHELYDSNEKFAKKADIWVLTEYAPVRFIQREGPVDFKPSALMQQLQMYTLEEVN